MKKFLPFIGVCFLFLFFFCGPLNIAFAQCTYTTPSSILAYHPEQSCPNGCIQPKSDFSSCELYDINLFVAGIVKAEIGAFTTEIKAYQSQAVIARTWVVRNNIDETPAGNGVAYSVIDMFDPVDALILFAVMSTKDQVIIGNDPNGTDFGKVILAKFSAWCDGKETQASTERAKNDCTYTNDGFYSYLVSMPASGHMPCMLPTNCCEMPDGKHIYGHGVGACQWCMRKYAEDGWDYNDIVLSFYKGTCIANLSASTTAKITATKNNVCENESITLTAVGFSGSVNWYRYGYAQLVSTGTTYTVVPDSSRTYVAKDADNNEAYFTVMVHLREKLHLSGSKNLVYQNNEPNTYSAIVSHQNLSGHALELTNADVVRPNPDFTDTALYKVQVIDIHGCKTLDSIVIDNAGFQHYGTGDLVCHIDSLTYDFINETYHMVYTIWNIGALPSKQTTSYIWSASAIDFSTIPGSTITIPPLNEGKFVTESITFPANSVVSNATTIAVIIDNFAGEIVTSNNFDSKDIQFEGQPDLKILSGEMSYAYNAGGIDKLAFKNVSVKNIGNSSSITGDIEYTAYWSTDSLLDANDYVIGDAIESYAHVSSLNAGESTSPNLFNVYPYNTFKMTEYDGGYILLVVDARHEIVRDPNIANNVLVFKKPTDKYVDYVCKLTITNKPASPLEPTKIELSYANFGTMQADPKYINVYVSKDSVVSDDDILLFSHYITGTFPKQSTLGVGLTKTIQLNELPKWNSDSLYLIAWFDPEQESTEPNEVNNVSAVLWEKGVITQTISSNTKPEIVVYPNPVKAGGILELSDNREYSFVELYDLTGKTSCIERNKNLIHIPLDTKPQMYILRIVTDNAVINKKIIVIN